MTPDELFYELHQGLARQAPGSDATTRLLATLAGPLPVVPRTLDVGCGPGRSSLVLAESLGAQITAIDDHQPFLDDLAARAVETGLSGLIRTQLAAMEALPFEDGAFDLIWAEGSAYVMGFDAALASWRRLLAPGGALVLTECEWITLTPSAATRGFWDVAYPAMRSTAANVDAAMAASWKVAATYVLPDARNRPY